MWETALNVLLGAGIGGFVGATVRDFGFRGRLNALEIGQQTLEMSVKGQKGNAARADLEEENDNLLIEAATLLKSGELTKDNAAQKLAELGLKYPRAAKRLIAKGGLDLRGLSI